HLGLATAVNSLCREVGETSMLTVEVVRDGDLGKVPKDIALCAYRITQEALRNCMKHSDAENVRVALVSDGHNLRLSVSDDGHGMDMESEEVMNGLGFISMWERVRTVEGEIRIQSQPRLGTLIEVSIPF